MKNENSLFDILYTAVTRITAIPSAVPYRRGYWSCVIRTVYGLPYPSQHRIIYGRRRNTDGAQPYVSCSVLRSFLRLFRAKQIPNFATHMLSANNSLDQDRLIHYLLPHLCIHHPICIGLINHQSWFATSSLSIYQWLPFLLSYLPSRTCIRSEERRVGKECSS